jgi:predicted dehydrogenase
MAGTREHPPVRKQMSTSPADTPAEVSVPMAVAMMRSTSRGSRTRTVIGTMRDLFRSIETGGLPTISGSDNLKTLQLVFGCYGAAEEKRAVRPSEIASS